MGRGLGKSVVDVFIAAFNQIPGERAGPVGRITQAKNVIVTKYDPGQGQPQRMKVQQRNGFATLSTVAREVEAAEIVTVLWANPELLTTLGDQLLSIPNARPRVWNGVDWSAYPYERVVTNQLSQSVLHTTNKTIQAPDSAWLEGVTCSVWTETDGGSPASVAAYIGFRADDGTWLVKPQVLHDPEDDIDAQVIMARVASDGEVFWVTYNIHDGADRFLMVKVYDTHGMLLAEDSTLQFDALTPGPGYWDITPVSTGGINIAQPANAQGAGTGAIFTLATYAASLISLDTNIDATVECNGPIAWLTNDLDDGLFYCAVLNTAGDLFAYQVTGNAATHEYVFGITFTATPDSLIGWVEESATPDEPTVYVSASELSTAVQTAGPVHDPGFRKIRTWSCTWADEVDQQRQINSLIAVSRAFLHDSDYYAMTYYQSGSGLQQPSALSVTVTAGDYLTGPQQQPLELSETPFTSWTEGSPFSAAGIAVVATAAMANVGITGTDTMATVVASGIPGLVEGQSYSFVTFANGAFTGALGSKLVIAGSSGVSGADGEYIIAATPSATTAYVWSVSRSFPVGTFSAGGTIQADQMAQYHFALGALDDNISDTSITATFFNGTGATINVSGSAAPNNGLKTIYYVAMGGEIFNGGPIVYVDWVAQTSDPTSFASVISPGNPNEWRLAANGDFGPVYDGLTLSIAGDVKQPNNNGDHEITTAAGGLTFITGNDGSIVAEFLDVPPTTAAINLVTGVRPYTFFLQDITVDESFIGAVISIQGALWDENDGTYIVTGVDVTENFLYATPASGESDQHAESFSIDPVATITVFFPSRQSATFQPIWFMTPLKGGTPPDPDITGAFWVMADVGTVLSGSDLTTWEDQDPLEQDLTETVAGYEPQLVAAAINGLPAFRIGSATDGNWENNQGIFRTSNLRYNATDEFESGVPRTIYAVIQPEDWVHGSSSGTGPAICRFRDGGTLNVMGIEAYNWNNSGLFHAYQTNDFLRTASTIASYDAAPIIVKHVYDGTLIEVYINGVQLTLSSDVANPADTSATPWFGIGRAGHGGLALFGEVKVFYGVTSAEVDTFFMAYLANKWGITL